MKDVPVRPSHWESGDTRDGRGAGLNDDCELQRNGRLARSPLCSFHNVHDDLAPLPLQLCHQRLLSFVSCRTAEDSPLVAVVAQLKKRRSQHAADNKEAGIAIAARNKRLLPACR